MRVVCFLSFRGGLITKKELNNAQPRVPPIILRKFLRNFDLSSPPTPTTNFPVVLHHHTTILLANRFLLLLRPRNILPYIQMILNH